MADRIIIDDEAFVRAWNGARSTDEVVVTFGLRTRRQATCIACALRKRGLGLKRFRGGPRRRGATKTLARLDDRIARARSRLARLRVARDRLAVDP